MLSKNFYDHLSSPFAIDDISVRVGVKTKDRQKAMPMFYLIADAVRQRLDLACSIEGASWNYEFQIISSPSELVACNINNKSLCVKATITIQKGEMQVSRSSVGEEAFDKADGQEVYKSAETDAFKRAASRFGVGGYLRSLEKMWFPINGDFFVDKERDIVEAVYKASKIDSVEEEMLNAFYISTKLDEKIREFAPSLKIPCPFLEKEFCSQYEQKNNLKQGSWWTIGKVCGVPIRSYSSEQISMLALTIKDHINEDNFLDALVLSKALIPSARYPEHFGKGAK